MIDTPDRYQPVSAFFQFCMISITCLIIGFCLYRSSRHFTSNDPIPTIEKFSPKILTQFGGEPNIISTGLYISDFISFDLVKNNVVFIGTIWFEFDPEMVTLDLINKFKFDRAEILEKSEPDARISNKKLLVRYTIKVHQPTQMNYQYFPFDNHRIFIKLIQPATSPVDVIFNSVTSNFVVDASSSSFGWDLIDKQVTAGFTQSNVQRQQAIIYHPAVLFSIDCLRNGVRYALTIFLPLMAIFFISLFIFSIDATKNATFGITLAAGSITALLAYRFVIENLSPAVGYFMISDYIYLLFLFLVALVFLCSIILPQLSSLTKKLIVIALHTILSGSYIYFMLIWMT